MDLRFSYWDGNGKDFFVFHGTDKPGNPNVSYLRMAKVLVGIITWINQPGHEREIVWLGMDVYRESYDLTQSKTICDGTLGWELTQGKVIQSSMLPPNTALTDMSMNEIWALPGQPRIIVTGWSSCTGNDPMTSGGAYADQCGENVWNTIYPELEARKDWATGELVTGAYALDIQATPYSDKLCIQTIRQLAPEQFYSLFTLFSTGAAVNIGAVAGDFLGDPAGEGSDPTNWPIVQTALQLNQSPFPVLSWTTKPGASVTVSCNNPNFSSPTKMVVYPVVQGPQSPNLKTFTSGAGSPGVQGSVSSSDFSGAGPAPDGSYLVAACAYWGSPLDPPGSSAAEISRIVIPHYPFVPYPDLAATPADPVNLPFTCSFATQPGASANASGTETVQVTAYPTADPLSPDTQTFDAPAGQLTLQATYSRRGSYGVQLDCARGGASNGIPVPDSAFPPALTVRTNQTHRFLYCDRGSQVKGLFTLSLAAITPNAPTPLSVTGFPDKITAVLTVPPDYFPPGDYLLTATCVGNVSSGETHPWTATPLTLSSSQIAHREVSAEITGCSAQGGNDYACALQVTLGAPLAVNTVFSVGIQYLGSGNGGFANPTGGDKPQVTAFQGCQVPPLPSPYLADGNGSYTRYDVNIGPGGCPAGAVVTFGQAVMGAGAAPITQSVTVPGLGAITTTPVLLP